MEPLKDQDRSRSNDGVDLSSIMEDIDDIFFLIKREAPEMVEEFSSNTSSHEPSNIVNMDKPAKKHKKKRNHKKNKHPQGLHKKLTTMDLLNILQEDIEDSGACGKSSPEKPLNDLQGSTKERRTCEKPKSGNPLNDLQGSTKERRTCEKPKSGNPLNDVPDVTLSTIKDVIHNLVSQPIITEIPAAEVENQKIQAIIDLTGELPVEVKLKRDIIIIDEDESGKNNSSVTIGNPEEKGQAAKKAIVPTNETCTYTQVESSHQEVSVKSSTSSHGHLVLDDDEEDGELKSNEDDDITGVPFESYPENVLNGLRLLIAQENMHLTNSCVKMNTTSSTDVIQNENINRFERIVQEQSNKLLEQISKTSQIQQINQQPTITINKKDLTCIYDKINKLSKDLLKVKKSKHKKKHHHKSKTSRKHDKRKKRDLRVRSISESLSSSSSCDNLPKQYRIKSKSRTSSELESSNSKTKGMSKYSPSQRRLNIVGYSSSSSSDSRSCSYRKYSIDKVYNYKSKFDSEQNKQSNISKLNYSLNEHTAVPPNESKKRRYSFSSSSESPPRYKKKIHRRSSSKSPTRFDHSKQRTSSKSETTIDKVFESKISTRVDHPKRRTSPQSEPTRNKVLESSHQPSTSGRTSLVVKDTFEQNLVQVNNVVQRQTTLTRTFKEQFLTHNKQEESDFDAALYKLQLSVYNEKGKDVTRKRPGGDIRHKFYIHPEVAELYQVRTRNGLLPSQALHELCTKCFWNLPTYLNLPSEKGFKFGMVLNDHHFITSVSASQKKQAKAEACKVVLQWLRIIDIP